VNGSDEGPWFVEHPELLERELDALSRAGLEVEVDEAARTRGVLRLRFSVPVPGGDVRNSPGEGEDHLALTAVYPDSYPYFRPQVYAAGLSLPRHQHPFEKNLCLLPRPSQFWNPEWTLAHYLAEQLPRVLSTGKIVDPEAIAADPDEQAEPISEFYAYERSSHVLLDASFVGPDFGTDPDLASGTISVGLPSRTVLPAKMAALEVRDGSGKLLSRVPDAVARAYTKVVQGTWYRLLQPPPVGDAQGVGGWLLEHLRKQGRRVSVSRAGVPVQGGKIRGVIGLAFPEEVEPGKMGWGWAFLVEITVRQTISPLGKKGGKARKIPVHTRYLAPASRIGANAYQARIPKLFSLRDRTLLVVGLGALGAPSALDFARAGVGCLRLLDFDTFDPATTVRWPMGIAAAGVGKHKALEQFITENYPYTAVEVIDHQFGAPRLGAEGEGLRWRPEWEVIAAALDGADLIYDASAEEGVSHLLSMLSRERGIPFVQVYGTRGAWGGLVMREVPGKTEGCWMCLQHAITDGTIVPPPEDPTGGVQPLGCGDPTFTGTSFDVLNVALAGVRMSVSTLCMGITGAYPEIDWDVGILEMVAKDGAPVAPAWRTSRLLRHAGCPYHVGT